MTNKFSHSRQKVALVRCPLASHWNIPLALPSLAAFIEMYDYEVKCWDLNLEFQDFMNTKDLPLSLLDENKWYRLQIDSQIEAILSGLAKSWAEMILRDAPTVVGFSIPVVTVKASLILAQAIKMFDSNIVTVFGGPECMYSWPDLIKEDVVDFVILGEGEQPFVDLLQVLDRGGKQVHNPAVVTKDTCDQPHSVAINNDLDQLPYPDFSKMEFERYADHGVVDIPIFGSVGCVRNCTFCSRHFLNGKYRYKSSHKIVSELERAVELYGTKSFFFVDSLINGRIDQLSEWTSLVVDKQMGIRWHSNAILSPDTTKDVLRTMRQSGCIRLWYGLESGSPLILKDMKKLVDIPIIERVIRDTHDVGIIATCFVMVGYPTETEADFQATLDFLKRNKSHLDEVYPLLCEVQDETLLGGGKRKYGIVGSGYDWVNSTSNLDVRKKRLQQLLSVLQDLGISTHQDTGRDFVGTNPWEN